MGMRIYLMMLKIFWNQIVVMVLHLREWIKKDTEWYSVLEYGELECISYILTKLLLNKNKNQLLKCYWTSEPVKLLSRVWLFEMPWTVAYQSPPSMEFSMQEYWSVLPFPSPGDLPDPGTEPRSPTLQAEPTIWAAREDPLTTTSKLFERFENEVLFVCVVWKRSQS